jgi:type I restriction enzyme S subunit
MDATDAHLHAARWQPYPAYKPSGVEWLGDIPAHWEVRKLKHAASVTFSTVDKHTFEGEQPVRLCNYVDVYYNDLITEELEFMKATATSREVARFTLRQGDVLVTKDSESWEDIAVSAYVPSTLSNVVCGYHLAHVRPDCEVTDGKYLFRAFQARGINDQFRVAANGITRYGLPKSGIDNSLFLTPPLDEQRAIAAFLDRETTRLDALMAKKQRLIELLQEQRTALISQAVTKGLDPNVAMKDSGVAWLGEIPVHWEVARAKQVSGVFIPQRNKPDLNSDTGLPWITMEDIARPSVDGSIATRFVTESAAREADSKPLPKDSVIVSCVGNLGIASVNTEPVIINQQLQAYLPKRINGWFLRYLVGISKPYFDIAANATTLAYVNREGFAELPVVVPSVDEQAAIVLHLDQATKKIDLLIAKVNDAIERLREYRTALIAAAVTGKIKVFNG